MNSKKGFKYYLFVFSMSVVAIFIYLMINSFGGNEVTVQYIISILTVPFMFTLFLFLFDRLLGFFMPKKKNMETDVYEQFLVTSTEKLRNTNEFTIEDFKRFRTNERFQRTLKMISKIEVNGETQDANYKMVEKRFKKDTIEHKAIQYLISNK